MLTHDTKEAENNYLKQKALTKMLIREKEDTTKIN